MNVLVIGGTGFLGKSLQKIKPNWTYWGTKDCNLTNYWVTCKHISELMPDAIIHLAGKVGGIKENSKYPGDFYYQNTIMNTHIIEIGKILGIRRILSSLSTCAFPDILDNYPFTENDILNGPPAKTNLSYGFSKRNLYVMSNAYREQYGLNYSTFCPSNLYGPNDNFDLESSHFVPAMIRKFEEANDGDILEFWGTGKPLRQQLFVRDLAKAIPILLEHHNTNLPIIVAPDENLSIEEMIMICQNIYREQFNKNIEYKFNGQLDGQFRKDGDNSKFKELMNIHSGFKKFKKFKQGLLETIKWYKEYMDEGL